MIEIAECSGVAIIKTQTRLGANCKAFSFQFFKTVHIIVWNRIGTFPEKVLFYFRSIKAVQSVTGSNPKETIVVLSEVIDFITAKSFTSSNFFNKIGGFLCCHIDH